LPSSKDFAGKAATELAAENVIANTSMTESITEIFRCIVLSPLQDWLCNV
jgi:hypothetical protein